MGVFGRGPGRSTGFGQRDSACDVVRRGLRRGSQEPQDSHRARAGCGQWGIPNEVNGKEGEGWRLPRQVRRGGAGQRSRSSMRSGLG